MLLKRLAWLTATLIAAVAQTVAVAATGESATPLGQRCEVQTSGGDHRDIRCPLDASGTSRRFRFKASFSGGHDDTNAKLTATLDGAPLACDEGSKTSLFAEDGDVSLECRFSVPAKAEAGRAFGVVLLWSHCQYTGFELVPD